MHFFAVSVVAEGSSGNDIVTGVEELIQVTHQQATGVMLLTSILGGLIGASLFWIARPPLPREGAARFRRSQWRRLAAVLAAFGVTLWIVRLLPERRQFLATLILGYLVLPVLAIAGTSCAGRRVKAACLGMAPTWLALPNTSYQVMLIISMEDGVSADGFSTPYQLALLAFAASGLANLWLVTSQRKSHAQHRRLNSLSTCVRRRATLFPQPTSCCDGGP
ncbi:MAG: hypothetical protein KDB14_26500 [Planctomycetales bacterium]|nr:hypothetical protein [Planctomycetales bacterium]